MARRFTRRNFLNLAALAAGAPIFELKPLRGIDFILQNSPTRRKFLIKTMPGGIALFDYKVEGSVAPAKSPDSPSSPTEGLKIVVFTP